MSSANSANLLNLLYGHDPFLPAVRTVDGFGMTYGRLRTVVEATGVSLRRMDIQAGDPVAIVLPNGPHMATAFLSVAAAATAAPLHPGLREREFRAQLEDLAARALVVSASARGESVTAARDVGVPVLELEPTSTEGDFRLVGSVGSRHADPSAPSDTALLLSTSGTTSRPKLVPLSHANLVASAANIARTLRLAPSDAALNLMPLFHIHGLVGVLLASMRAGAEVIAAPGFQPLQFFRWLAAARPTWYSAVPTMHQAIVQRSARASMDLHDRLRLARSSSAALPPSVLAEIEQRFECPVIESYGMTEASHQMTSNPLPPSARKPGSVGVPAGPEVAVMDGAGRLLGNGETGQIVIRGANVMRAYLRAPAGGDAFRKGWFCTGDLGFRDEDGYYTISGRLKELINRGGEKISPREIDEAMLLHPDIKQAVAFALPHTKLGEDIAAAVVLAEGSTLTRKALRTFLSERISAHKVPREVVFTESIPKGPSGKLRRIGLAQALGLTSSR